MASSVYSKILDAVTTTTKTVTLTGITTSTNVVQMTVPSSGPPMPSTPFPGVIIAPFGGERLGRGSNISDDIGYPVLVCIVDAGNQTHTDAGLDTRLVWRENIIDKFIRNRSAVSISSSKGNINDVEIDTLTAVDPSAWFDRNIFASPILLIVWFRKQRRA